jgi:hypothetical protein
MQAIDSARAAMQQVESLRTDPVTDMVRKSDSLASGFCRQSHSLFGRMSKSGARRNNPQKCKCELSSKLRLAQHLTDY